jgi:hypothetical protein
MPLLERIMELILQPDPTSQPSKALLEGAIHLLESGEKATPKTTL